MSDFLGASPSASIATVANVTAAIQGSTQTQVGTSAPSLRADGTSLQDGDLWVDSSNNNNLHRFSSTANDFVLVRDTTNDDQAKVFTQTTQPASSSSSTGDLWFDTDDSNKLYRFDGSNWQVVRDVTEIGLRQTGDQNVLKAAATLTRQLVANLPNEVAGIARWDFSTTTDFAEDDRVLFYDNPYICKSASGSGGALPILDTSLDWSSTRTYTHDGTTGEFVLYPTTGTRRLYEAKNLNIGDETGGVFDANLNKTPDTETDYWEDHGVYSNNASYSTARWSLDSLTSASITTALTARVESTEQDITTQSSRLDNFQSSGGTIESFIGTASVSTFITDQNTTNACLLYTSDAADE